MFYFFSFIILFLNLTTIGSFEYNYKLFTWENFQDQKNNIPSADASFDFLKSFYRTYDTYSAEDENNTPPFDVFFEVLKSFDLLNEDRDALRDSFPYTNEFNVLDVADPQRLPLRAPGNSVMLVPAQKSILNPEVSVIKGTVPDMDKLAKLALFAINDVHPKSFLFWYGENVSNYHYNQFYQWTNEERELFAQRLIEKHSRLGKFDKNVTNQIRIYWQVDNPRDLQRLLKHSPLLKDPKYDELRRINNIFLQHWQIFHETNQIKWAYNNIFTDFCELFNRILQGAQKFPRIDDSIRMTNFPFQIKYDSEEKAIQQFSQHLHSKLPFRSRLVTKEEKINVRLFIMSFLTTLVACIGMLYALEYGMTILFD
jgi:hypothetical protein